MPIDTNIYSNIKQFQAPDAVESMGRAMQLSQYAKQGQKLDQDLAKQVLDAKEAERSRLTKEAIPEFQQLMSLPQEKLAVEYGQTMKRLAAQGMPTDKLISDRDGNFVFDPQLFQMQVKGISSTPEWASFEKAQLDNQKIRSEISRNLAESRKKGSSEYSPYKQMQMEKLAMDLEDKKFSKTPEGRLQKLGAEQKQRLDNAKLGLISTRGMADALKAGDNTFSLIGDNDFTQQRALFEESLGRMQSGGAISKEEEKRFKEMAPTKWDSAEMQQKKLAQLEQEMNSRIATLGFKPEDVGISAGSSGVVQQGAGSIIPSANAKSGVTIKHGTEEDGFVFLGGDPSDKKNWKKAR